VGNYFRRDCGPATAQQNEVDPIHTTARPQAFDVTNMKEAIWFFVSGRGEMWRAQNGQRHDRCRRSRSVVGGTLSQTLVNVLWQTTLA
jgi:hypothetical protein